MQQNVLKNNCLGKIKRFISITNGLIRLNWYKKSFEDIKVVIRIRKSKTAQWPEEKYKRTNNDQENIAQ